MTESANKLSTWVAATACGIVLLSGFFFAGKQHFSSMEYGIRNSKLRKELDDLRAEKQRLLYTREVALSPNQIKKAASKAGIFAGRTDSAIAPEMASTRRQKKAAPSADNNKPLVIRTASVDRAVPRAERTLQVVARNEKPQKDKPQSR